MPSLIPEKKNKRDQFWVLKNRRKNNFSFYSSYGLAVAPRVRFLNKVQKGQQESLNKDAFSKPSNEFVPLAETKLSESDSDISVSDDDDSIETEIDDGDESKIRKNSKSVPKSEAIEESDEDGEFLKVARTDVFQVLSEPTVEYLL